MPRPTLAELKESFRRTTPNGAGDHGEALAQRWIILLELQYARVRQNIYNKSPELTAIKAKRPDFFAQIPGDNDNVIVLDAKYRTPEVLNSFSMSETELQEYLNLLTFLRQKYPNRAFHLFFMYMPKVAKGEELIWITLSDVERAEECVSFDGKSRRVMLDRLPKDQPEEGGLPTLPQPDRLKSAFLDGLAMMMLNSNIENSKHV